MKATVGIIGYGTMGQALAEGIKGEYAVIVFDKDAAKLKDAEGVEVAKDPALLAAAVETLILCVKPQDFAEMLTTLKGVCAGKRVISIAAGVTTASIERALGEVRVVRAMPNLAIKAKQGMTCMCKGAHATDDDLYAARDLFDRVGRTLEVMEYQMNAVTAVSGSGPGFLYYFLEQEGAGADSVPDALRKKFEGSLSDAAERFIPLDKREAEVMAHQTVEGSLTLLRASGLAPAALRKQVTSKGGTTEAGLAILASGGTLQDAVQAALDRAQELSKG